MTASRKDVVMNAIFNRQTRSRRYDYSSDSADMFHARGSFVPRSNPAASRGNSNDNSLWFLLTCAPQPWTGR